MVLTGDIAQPFVGASNIAVPLCFETKLLVCNLEGSLVEGNQSYTNGGYKGVYNEIGAIEGLKKYISISACSIANNHLLDSAGVNTTLENLRRLGILSVGGGCNLEEAQKSCVLKDRDGISYRILAFGWESIQCVPAKDNAQGVNPYTRENVIQCVEKALMGVEPVICFMHWDYELERYPQPYDRRLAMDLIDMGVAAVIGCHAHRVQPVEFYKGKPIVYGLGNFLFCQGHYFDGKLCFPGYCQEEYAFEISDGQYKLHYFKYDQTENRLEYVKSAEVSPDAEFEGKAEFSGMSDKEYEDWFRIHRVQRKLLPVFKAHESSFCYRGKSAWIKLRGAMINMLSSMNLKSANRADK